MKVNKTNLLTVLGLSLLMGVTSCDGGGSSSPTGSANEGGVRATLTGVEYGRLVDIYAYRRIDPNNADRLLGSGRKPVLVAKEVLINPDLRGQDIFASNLAQYRFMPYDPSAGRRELLILWDDQNPAEADAFQRALENAQAGLKRLGSFAAFQNVSGTVIPPVLPYDAAIQLSFDRALGPR
jgi:hypothetical protein